MKLQDRINKIRNKAESIKVAQQAQEQRENDIINSFYKKIKELAPRIKKLIILGNELYRQGLLEDYFYTDGWTHSLGFNRATKRFKFRCDNTPIKFLGIECGGACGDTDLWVNSEGNIKVAYTSGLWSKSGKLCDNDKISTWALKRFAENFDVFEQRLLKYIDSL